MTTPRVHDTGLPFLMWLLLWTGYLFLYGDVYLDHLCRAVDGQWLSPKFHWYVLFPVSVLVANAAMLFVARWVHPWGCGLLWLCEPVVLMGYHGVVQAV